MLTTHGQEINLSYAQWLLESMEYPLTQQWEFCPTIPHPFDEFELVHLPFIGSFCDQSGRGTEAGCGWVDRSIPAHHHHTPSRRFPTAPRDSSQIGWSGPF